MSQIDEHHDYETVGRALDTRLLRRLVPFVGADGRGLGIGFALLFVITGLELLGPYLLRLAIDGPVSDASEAALHGASGVHDVLTPERRNELLLLAGAFALCLVAALVARYAQMLILSVTGARILRRIRDAAFEQLQRLPIQWFSHQPTGRLVSRVTSDVETLNELFTSGIVTLVADILKVVALLIVVFYLNARLAILALISVPIITIISAWFRVRARQAYRETRSEIAKVNAYLGESVSGFRIIQGFAREDKAQAIFQTRNDGYLVANLRTVFYFALFFPVVDWITYTVQGGVFWRSGIEIAGTTLTYGEFIQFWSYLTFMFEPLRELAEKYNVLQSAMASAERIFTVLDAPPEPTDAPDALPSEGLRGEIRFDGVGFEYDEGRPVLKDISFTAQAGETIAIVGATGGGKTTLTSLLLRMHDPTIGTIRIDGVPIDQYRRRELRARLAYVQQDVFLFAGTVMDNLRIMPPAIEEESAEERSRGEAKVLAAAKAIGADEIIRQLPDGYQTVLTERGGNLSGGERQLISFARALAIDPAVLILDEATASVDPETEARVQHAIDTLLSGRTSLVIAHRLSTIKKASRILVLHHGELREQGTHQELMDHDGIYRRLYDLQFSRPPERRPQSN